MAACSFNLTKCSAEWHSGQTLDLQTGVSSFFISLDSLLFIPVSLRAIWSYRNKYSSLRQWRLTIWGNTQSIFESYQGSIPAQHLTKWTHCPNLWASLLVLPAHLGLPLSTVSSTFYQFCTALTSKWLPCMVLSSGDTDWNSFSFAPPGDCHISEADLPIHTVSSLVEVTSSASHVHFVLWSIKQSNKH